MCHCGDDFCDIRPDIKLFAKVAYDTMLNSEYWQKKYPDATERSKAVVAQIHKAIVMLFDEKAIDFKWK